MDLLLNTLKLQIIKGFLHCPVWFIIYSRNLEKFVINTYYGYYITIYLII